MNLVKDDSGEREGWWTSDGCTFETWFIPREVAELIVKRERRRAARLAMKRVPCSICGMNVNRKTGKLNAQFCDSFGCSSFRELADEIMGKKKPPAFTRRGGR